MWQDAVLGGGKSEEMPWSVFQHCPSFLTSPLSISTESWEYFLVTWHNGLESRLIALSCLKNVSRWLNVPSKRLNHWSLLWKYFLIHSSLPLVISCLCLHDLKYLCTVFKVVKDLLEKKIVTFVLYCQESMKNKQWKNFLPQRHFLK